MKLNGNRVKNGTCKKATTRATVPTICKRWKIQNWNTSPHPWSHHNCGSFDLVQSVNCFGDVKASPDPSNSLYNVWLNNGRQQDFGTQSSFGHELMLYQSLYDSTPQHRNYNTINIVILANNTSKQLYTFLWSLSQIEATEGAILPPISVAL